MIDPTSFWNLSQRIAFRFFFSFFLLYMLSRFTYGLFHVLVPWFAQHVLRLEKPITIFTNGSGDTTYDYVTVLCYLLIALLIALVWSLLDRKKQSYMTLNYWLCVFLRYYLAMMMFTYGFIKIYHLQMPSPSFMQLIQEFGDKSPMGLVWSYIGFSKGFSLFTGCAEVVAGFFLLFRKTVTLGALLTAIVTINILAINLFFDVPVKLFSAVLLLMALFIIAWEAKKLLNFFILNKPTASSIYPVLFKKKWMRIVKWSVRGLVIGYFFFAGIAGGLQGQKAYGDKRKKPVLYGLYDAELFVQNKDTIPPLATDGTRWKNLVIEREKMATIKMMNDSLRYYSFAVDTANKKVSFYIYADSAHKNSLSYEKANNYLTLQGKLNGDSVFIRLKERDIQSFRLMNRGFRWVNEYPYNR